MDFQLFKRCETCKKRKFYIAKRLVKIPIGEIKSQKRMCGQCYKDILKMMSGDVKI